MAAVCSTIGMLTTAQLAQMPPGPPVHVPVENVGWDINALPNERTDVEGRVTPAPIDDAGNMEDQTSPPLRAYDAPEVVALRERLAEHNGESLRMHIVGAARLPPLSSVLDRACLAQA